MIKRILIISAVVFVLGLLSFWLFTGGIDTTARTAKNLLNPIDFIFGTGTSTGRMFRLPWQPEIPTGPDISKYTTEIDGGYQNTDYQDTQGQDRAEIEAQYGSLIEGSSDPRTFGNTSPNTGKVTFANTATGESNPAREYVVIRANMGNGAPISIGGWSIQSAVSGLRVAIGQGTPLFVLGVVNVAQSIYLEPGASAILVTGASPVGTSFRENICSGYLNELQSFTPELSSECPLPSDALSLTADNLRTYGNACVDYVRAIPQCHFPSAPPANLSTACRSFITNTLSYNGCVRMHSTEPSFTLSSWRVYLGLRSQIWNDVHDVIRLLDDKGQVVDVLTY